MNLNKFLETYIKEDDILTGNAGAYNEKLTLQLIRAIRFLTKLMETKVLKGDHEGILEILEKISSINESLKNNLKSHPKLKEI